jgi:signal transduction histidine kinase
MSAATADAEVAPLAAQRPAILIVEDEPRNRMALQELLVSPECEVVAVESGLEALRQVLKRDFAVIVLDVRMPEMDGFETARLIRERERSRHIPIIFLTGASEDVHSMFRGYELGAVDYITKPPIPQILKSKIAVFIELFRKTAVLTQEVAERKHAEERLLASEENLRALTARLLVVREEEWQRISREIHDELGQLLTGLKMEINLLLGRLPRDQPELTARADSVFKLIDDTIQTMRRIASGLRPEALDHLGLIAGIEWHLRDFRRRSGIRCELSLPHEMPALDSERSLAVFRIFQELLTNVARHAAATRIDIDMRVEAGALVLTVADNGKGITESSARSPKSLGLLGIRERLHPFGGTAHISGSPGRGTKATVSIPL